MGVSNQNLEIEFRRKVISERVTLYVALPKPWVKALGVRKGDYMYLKFGPDGILRIQPERSQ